MRKLEDTQIKDLRGVVESIQEGVREIRESGLNDKVLYLLIQHAAPTMPGHKISTRKLRIKEIEATLDGLDNLADYMFGEEE